MHWASCIAPFMRRAYVKSPSVMSEWCSLCAGQVWCCGGSFFTIIQKKKKKFPGLIPDCAASYSKISVFLFSSG